MKKGGGTNDGPNRFGPPPPSPSPSKGEGIIGNFKYLCLGFLLFDLPKMDVPGYTLHLLLVDRWRFLIAGS